MTNVPPMIRTTAIRCTLRTAAVLAAALALAPCLSAANDASIAGPTTRSSSASAMGGSDWSNSGRIGAFVSDVSTEDSQGSREIPPSPTPPGPRPGC